MRIFPHIGTALASMALVLRGAGLDGGYVAPRRVTYGGSGARTPRVRERLAVPPEAVYSPAELRAHRRQALALDVAEAKRIAARDKRHAGKPRARATGISGRPMWRP